MKRCPYCDRLLPVEAFVYGARCGDCRANRQAVWYAANRKRVRAKHAEWYAANRKSVAARGAAWKAANPESAAASKIAWDTANPERVRIIARAKGQACRALKRGEIRPRPAACERCGRTNCWIELSHFDYAKPLWVEFICKGCHTIKDRANPLSLPSRDEAAVAA